MKKRQIFLSVVVPVQNQAGQLKSLLQKIEECISGLVYEYEVVIVDNASHDNSVQVLQELLARDGFPNCQVYVLTKEVNADTAYIAGIENSLGDYVVAIDPTRDDIAFLPTMLERAEAGADVVFARNEAPEDCSVTYRLLSSAFDFMYRKLNGISLVNDAPQYRLISKRVVNFILQHKIPVTAYRYLPASSGFPRVNLSYRASTGGGRRKRLGDSVDRGIRLIVSTTRAPMRLVTFLSLFGAVSNIVYSLYVIAVAVLKSDVAPGWVTLSLQQSGMFLLISLVLLVLGEYIIHMANLSNDAPLYHIAQEFTSERMTHREKLNLEEVQDVQLAQGAGEDRYLVGRK